MEFSPFEHLLFREPSDSKLDLRGRGQFDHLAFMTYLPGNVNLTEASIVTLHERWHHELNNVSTYGCILSAYAQLARHAKSDRQAYGELFRGLAERARTAHEVYATWYSVELLSERMPRQELLALHPLEYQQYFNQGAALVESLDNHYLRQQAFLCALRLCFESSALAESAHGLALWDLATVRLREFPNERLRMLASILPPNFFQLEFDRFLNKADECIAAIVQSAYNSPVGTFRSGHAADEEDAATAELHRWLHVAIAKRFDDHGMPSNGYHHHLAFLNEICPRLEVLCATEGPTYHRLIPSVAPFDNVANLLVQAENEVLYFRESPLPATLCRFADLSKERHPALVVGRPAHWFLCIRSPEQVLAQHKVNMAQAKLIGEMTEPLVYLRRRWSDAEGSRCELVLFQSPEELIHLRRLVAEVPALACISSLSLTYESWCDRWLTAIGEEFLTIILFDLSLSQTLREGWPEFSTVHYAKGILKSDSTRNVFLTFLGTRKNGSCAVYVIPCTEMFEGAVVSFIHNRLTADRFIQEDQFLRDLIDAVPVVVQHIVAEEHFFSLNQIEYGQR